MSINTVGRVERVDLPDIGVRGVPAKVDTGADSSSIWVEKVQETADGLKCVFFGPDSPYYTGEYVNFPSGSYRITRVSSSFGHREFRYKVKIRVKIAKRTILASFTLSNRSAKTYPILIGRRLLHGKFLVDVSKGRPLVGEERRKRAIMQKELGNIEQKTGSNK